MNRIKRLWALFVWVVLMVCPDLFGRLLLRGQFHFKQQHFLCLGMEVEVWTLRAGRLYTASIDLLKVGIFSKENGHLVRSLPGNKIPGGTITKELPWHQLEMITGVCQNAGQLLACLKLLWQKIHSLAKQHHFELGSTPMPPHKDFEFGVYPTERYRQIVREIPIHVLRLAWILGEHVHLGCRNWRDAIKLFNGLRTYLPMLLAVSARYDEQTGRAERFFQYRQLKSDLAPPRVRNLAELVYHMLLEGFFLNAKNCWWVLRFSLHGTIECRIFDAQENSNHSVQNAALLRVLAHRILHNSSDDDLAKLDEFPRERLSRELVQVASLATAHYEYGDKLVALMKYAVKIPDLQAESKLLCELLIRKGVDPKDSARVQEVTALQRAA